MIRNKVQLIGFASTNPDVRISQNNKKHARITMATQETHRHIEDHKIRETMWHNLIAWDKNADIIEKYVILGTEIAVEGKLLYRDYIDKEGKKSFIPEIEVNEILILGHLKK